MWTKQALAGMTRGCDSTELARTCEAIVQLARTADGGSLLNDRLLAPRFVAALAVWRRCDPPTPPRARTAYV